MLNPRFDTSVMRDEATLSDAGLRGFMLRIYNFMSLGLLVTALAAYFVSSSAELMQIIWGTPLGWVVMFAPLGMALYFGARIERMTTKGAQTFFWVFAVLMGISLSTIFFAYTAESLVRVFFITAATFAATSLYGYTTKRSLMAMGSFLMMGVIGIVIASIVNLFLQSSALQFATSVIGVVVFTGIAAYHTQMAKQIYLSASGHAESLGKYAVMAAFSLYITFINLFISLLSLMGDRR